MAVAGGPNIVEDGLKVYLDANNPKSYPGSGNRWYNISPDVEVSYPTSVKNVMHPLNQWPLKRSVVTEIIDGSIEPPISGARVWSSQKNDSLFTSTLHRTGYGSATLEMPANLNMQYYQYSMYVRGDSSNSNSAGIQIDISDITGAGITVGTGSEWKRIITIDNSTVGNSAKFIDYSLYGEDLDTVYISAITLNMYQISQSKEARVLEEDVTTYIDYGGTLEIGPPSRPSFNATLINSPEYIQTSKVKYFKFDGINDYVVFDDFLDFTKGTSARLVFYTETTESEENYISLMDGTGFFRFNTQHSILSRHSADVRLSRPYLFSSVTEFTSSLSLNREFNDVTIVTDEDSTLSLYINGELHYPTGSVDGSIKLERLMYPFTNSGLSLFQFYNKTLTPQEVLQNYNATKSRFGL